MTILDDVLQEEQDRSKRMKVAMKKEISMLPQGYISKKNINEKSYYYLQRREGSKIVGTYIFPNEVSKMKDQIAKRKQLEKSIRELDANIKKIDKVIG